MMINIYRNVIIIGIISFECIIGLYCIENPKKTSITDNLKSIGNASTSQYKYEIRKIRVPVDHFSFSSNDTFELRYLVNNTWQTRENAPIFFYTGNEGWIEVFAQNTGFMWDIAPTFGALVIFAEHRYYGESMPYGNKSYSDAKHLGYLTSQQALADYVDLIAYLKTDPKLKDSAVIVFGGSYGGMLSAWFRIKYPHIVQGAIAASAPILQFTGMTDCHAFSRIVTSDFRAANSICPKVIRTSWTAIANITSTEKGKQWLSTTWKLCKPLNSTDDIQQFKDWLSNVYINLAMVDYPYESNFLAPLPANPVMQFCKQLTKLDPTHEELLTTLHKAVNIYANYTGNTSCIATEDAAPDLGATGWDYQACTEMVMPMCNDGINDMFEPYEWDFEKYSNDCLKKYNITPRPYLACQVYGCADLSTATNIVFSNGLLDPWSSGGVLRNLSQSAVAIVIPEGAHHLDMRGTNNADPFSVVTARKFHQHSIKKWIKAHEESILRKFKNKKLKKFPEINK